MGLLGALSRGRPLHLRRGPLEGAAAALLLGGLQLRPAPGPEVPVLDAAAPRWVAGHGGAAVGPSIGVLDGRAVVGPHLRGHRQEDEGDAGMNESIYHGVSPSDYS